MRTAKLFLEKNLIKVTVVIIILGVLIANEILYQVILLFRETFIADIVNFIRVLGWFLAPMAVMAWSEDVSYWIRRNILKNHDRD